MSLLSCNRRSCLFRLCTSLLSLISISSSRCAEIAWTNLNGGLWNASTNWSPNQVPGSSDNAYITNNGSYTVTVNTTVTINSLTLGGASGQQVLTNSAQTVTLNGASVVAANGILGLSGGTLTGRARKNTKH